MNDEVGNLINSRNLDLLQVGGLLRQNFDVTSSNLKLLSIGSINTLYRLPKNLVARISRRSAQHIEQEVKLTLLLREKGFDRVPNFVRSKDHRFAVEIDSETVLSLYHFIPGNVAQPLPEARFDAFLSILPSFLTAMEQIEIGAFPSRQRFPFPEQSLVRARELSLFVELPKPISYLLKDLKWVNSFPIWPHNRLIHGDLHAANLIWAKNGTFVGIIDFERFWIGNALVEICAFVTGTCFYGTELRINRVVKAVQRLGHHFSSCVPSAEVFVDALIIVALYFFGRVNRHLLDDRTFSKGCELRDALRANELLASRKDLTQALDKLLPD